jgi:cytochrome P450
MSQALLAARRRGPWRISGVEVPEGARLALLLASANRDEKAFEAPDAFDIRRSSANKTPRLQPRHPLLPRCPVGRLESRVAFELLARGLPDPRLSPPDERLRVRPERVVSRAEGALGGAETRKGGRCPVSPAGCRAMKDATAVVLLRPG